MAIAANSKRIVQMLWLAAGLLFALALLHSLGNPDKAKAWASNKVGNLINNDGGGRSSMREFMTTAEAIWAKTVKQRHEMIAEDYGDASLMPM